MIFKYLDLVIPILGSIIMIALGFQLIPQRISKYEDRTLTIFKIIGPLLMIVTVLQVVIKFF